MFRLIKVLFYLAIFTGLGILGYALFFELPAPQTEVTQAIDLDLG